MSKYSYPEDIEVELSRLQKRDRRCTVILIVLLVFVAVFSVRLYYQTQESTSDTSNVTQAAAQLSNSSVPQASVGGGCGGGDSSSSSSGGCGSSGGGGCGSSGGGSQVSAPDLEKQVLEIYKSQFGKVEGIAAKVIDLGCHKEIDVVDKGSNLLKKYQLRGGQISLLPQ